MSNLYDKYTKIKTPHTTSQNKIGVDRIMIGLVTARAWRIVAVISLLGNTILGLAISYLGTKPETIPFIVEVNDGRVVNYGKLRDIAQEYVPSEHIIRHQLENFIEFTRFVPGDLVVISKNLRKAYYMSSVNTVNKINAIQKKEGLPKELSTKITRDIQFINYISVSKHTKQIDWIEITYDLQGIITNKIVKRGIFTYFYDPATTEEFLIENPIGIFIDTFHMSEVRGE